MPVTPRAGARARRPVQARTRDNPPPRALPRALSVLGGPSAVRGPGRDVAALGVGEQRELALHHDLELFEVLLFERRRDGQVGAQRVDGLTILAELVVEVRSGHEAGRADVADHLLLGDARTGTDAAGEAAEVRVARLEAGD